MTSSAQLKNQAVGTMAKAYERGLSEYPYYRDSGVEWVGKIPSRWKMKRLKYCVDLINTTVDGRESDLPYTGLEHIKSWTGKRIPSGGAASSEGQSSLFRLGDVLFGKLRPYLAKVLRTYEEGICTGELLVLKPRSVTQDFLFYFMVSREFIGVVDASTYGAKMPRASWDFIGNLPMLVPPEDDQRAIAAFLDRETSRIDALIDKKQRQIKLLQEKRSALISHAVTKGLDPNVKMKDSGVEWLGTIPVHWTTKRIKHLVTIRGGQVDPRSDEFSGMLLIAPNHIESYTGRLLAQETAEDQGAISGKYLFRKGDILYSKIRPELAKVCLAPEDGLCSADMYAMIPTPGQVAEYVFYLLLSDAFTKLAVDESMRVAMPKINREDLGELMFPIPPQAEQKRIISHLAAQTGPIDLLLARIQTSIETLREYRTALISAAVTGKIDVRQEVA